MTTNDPKLDELKQRSHDYALWFIDTIFGALAVLLLFSGVAAIVFGVMSLQFDRLSLGCTMLISGSLLIVLLSILRTLKDIRLNSRELLKLQRSLTTKSDEESLS